MIRLAAILLAWATPAAAEVVATTSLQKGALVTRDVLQATAGEDLGDYLGLVLRRPIFEGRQVRVTDLERPPLVERQSSVAVTFRRGALALSLPGRAMRSGAEGDVVPVLIDGRRTPLRGVVVADGTVEIR